MAFLRIRAYTCVKENDENPTLVKGEKKKSHPLYLSHGML